jgi:hypothetical protein
LFGRGTPDPITGLAEGVDFNSAFSGGNTENPYDYTGMEEFDTAGNLMSVVNQDGGLDGNPLTDYAQGGAVQATPGAFNHDNGDGEFQTGENEILGFAQTANGLEDTGIRMTGGEFVINPDQAEGMEKAYDRIKRKKDPSRADLMALYEAVRFLDEPQFD